jgi:hypothetical protein
MRAGPNMTTGADSRVQAASSRHLALTATLCAGPDGPASGQPLDGIGAICRYGPG